MSKYLDVSHVNTMHVRDSYDTDNTGKWVTRYVELGVESCSCTYFNKPRLWGKQARQIECPDCKGVGKITRKVFFEASWGRERSKGKRGYRASETNECKRCYGSGHTHDWTHPITCERCHGAMVIPQNICNTLPQRFVDALEVRVYREGTHEHASKDLWKHQTACYSCSDYGEHTRLTDAELIAKVRESNHYVQATKLVQQDNEYRTSYKFAHHIGVLCSQGGYEVMAIFDDNPLVPAEETPKYHARRKAVELACESQGARS